MIIPRELKKKQTILGFNFIELGMASSVYVFIWLVTDVSSLLVNAISVLIGIILVLKVGHRPMYKIILNNIKFLYSKVFFFRNREIYLENKFKFSPKTVIKGDSIPSKISYPLRTLKCTVGNRLSLVKLFISKRLYLILNFRDSTLNEGEYDRYNMSFDKYNQLIINQNGGLYVVKKLIPRYTKWFNNEDEQDFFFHELYKFYSSSDKFSLYKYHDYSTYDFYDFDTKENHVLELYKKYQISRYEKVLNQSIPYFFVTYPYDEEDRLGFDNFQSSILSIVDCNENDVNEVDNVILGDINDVQELQIKKDHIVMILNDGEKYYQKYLSTTDIALKQNNYYIEKLLKEPRIDIKLDYTKYDKNEIIRVMDESITEADMRVSETDKHSKKGLEIQEMIVLSNYLELLNNDEDSICGFKLTIKIEGDSLEELESIENQLAIKYDNLQLNSELFVQKQLLNEWVLIEKCKEYKQLSQTDFTYGGLFNYSKVEDQNSFIKYTGEDGLISLNASSLEDGSEERLTSSKFISGKTGSGKTTLVKMFILEYAIDNKGVYNIDVQGDFVPLFRDMGGETIYIGRDKNIINPLQVSDWTSTDPLNNHLSYLNNFFSIGNPNYHLFSDKLIKLVSEFYKEYDLSEKSTNEEYPIFSDLYNFLQQNDVDESILEFIHKYSHTIYKNYFNGYTTINLDNDYINFCVADIKDNDLILNPVLVTILSFMRKKLYDPTKSCVFLFDEAHRSFANSFFKAFIETTTREARKFGSWIDLVTQNLSHIPKDIIDQMQYKIFLKTNEDPDIIAKSIFDESEAEANLLPNLKKMRFGEGIIVSDTVIYPIDFFFTDLEIKENIDLLYIFDPKILNKVNKGNL